MNLFNAKSEEDLKNYGKLTDLRNELSNILGSDVKIKSNTWSSLFRSITSLKKVTQYIVGDTGIANTKATDLYFKGEAERYIFLLLELDGKQRLDKLGVNRTHYSKKENAEKWRNEIAKIIHPDVCKHIQAERAMAELNEMYKEMIK